jgi:alpha-galactosidase
MSLQVKLIFLIYGFLGCSAIANAQEYTSGPYAFTVKSLQQPKITFTTKELKKNLTEVTFSFKAGETEVLSNEIAISWSVPFINIGGYWTTNGNDARFIRMGSSSQSNLAGQAPVVSLFGNNSDNRHTFALSDAFHPTIMNAAVNEDNARLNCSANVTLGKEEKITSYQLSILLDSRAVPFYESVKQVSSWWGNMPDYKPAHVPPAAKLPVYSTWYSYHQNFSGKELLKECTNAKAMGYETIILDDGWQTVTPGKGYAYTGDWNPERIKDMAGFVKKVHDTGMKFMLWYSVPFIGYRSSAYGQFKGKYLYQSDRLSAAVLDPRYPEVRKHITSKYVEDVKAWDLDGVKLDFIDSFINKNEVVPEAGKGTDFLSLYEAVDQLMVDIKKSLTAVNPDILIEFRQSYIGPAMRKYGNMFRAGDCPNAAMTNRIRTTDIKLLAGTTAVHSDMLMWNLQEPANLAALQFSSILFAVPQLSVKLSALPADHLNMVRFYTKYWLANKDVLLEGDFSALHPELNYPILMSTKKQKTIVGLYADMLVPVKDFAALDVINAKASEDVLLQMASAVNCSIEIYDCEGRLKNKSNLKFKKGTNVLKVPSSGIVKIHKIISLKK